jgi:excisionase family DNA binding protein
MAGRVMVATAHPTPAATTPDALPRQVPPKVAATYLECSEWTVRDMIRKGVLPAHHHGTRSWRIDRDVLVRFARGDTSAAAPATDLEARVAALEATLARLTKALTGGAS